MTRLILMRHAKSSWAEPGKKDHARPLNKRGNRAAAAIGHWMQEENYVPHQILSSSAKRTRETFEGLGIEGKPAYLDKLYEADPQDMLEVLRGATGATVLMIGHNPTIADFAHDLVVQAPDHPKFGGYPTCATLVVDFPVADWGEVQPGTGTPVDFIVPRELTD
jgi:phosphohistidine phosphatase